MENRNIMSTVNQHKTVYVVSPEFNSNNQMIFRDMLHIRPANVLTARKGRSWKLWSMDLDILNCSSSICIEKQLYFVKMTKK